MNELLSSNEPKYRLARTIIQGCIGVFAANIDLILGYAAISPEYRPVIVAFTMAALSPIMAEMGKGNAER